MSFSSEQQKVNIHTPATEVNVQNLEQMSDEEFWSYAHQRARAAPEQPSHAEYLECKLSDSAYLLPLGELAEVLPPPYRLARLPGMPAWMAGIMAWRGETIAIVNLDRYFLSSQSADLSQITEGVMLVVRASGQVLGLLVPAPGITITVELEEITPLSASAHMSLARDGGIFEGIYADIPILNISALLARLVQQIGMATAHG
ncbi:MAG TPA: chemotaxis protein CheW [Ktedonobacteraceae bacterium]